MSKCKLPKKPSKLLKIAFDDVRKVRKMTKLYKLDMGVFHEGAYSSSDKCEVCVAGAVMALTLKANPRKDMSPHQFEGCSNQLEAIDRFREGSIRMAFELLDDTIADWKAGCLEEMWSIDMEDPEDNYRAWSLAWRRFIKRCEMIGL